MTRLFLIVVCGFLASITANAGITRAEDRPVKKKFKLVRFANGRVMKNVTLWKHNEREANYEIPSGFGIIPMNSLPIDVQNAPGYNPMAEFKEKEAEKKAAAAKRTPQADMQSAVVKGKRISSGKSGEYQLSNIVVEVALKNTGKVKADAILEMVWFGPQGGVTRLPVTLEAGAFVTLKMAKRGKAHKSGYDYSARPDGSWVARVLKPSDGIPIAVTGSLPGIEKVSNELPNFKWNSYSDTHFRD